MIKLTATPLEEAWLNAKAATRGIAPEDVIHELLREQMSASAVGAMKQKLHDWQRETNTETLASKSLCELFAKWNEEDDRMTDSEYADEVQLWVDYRKDVDAERSGAEMRTLFDGGNHSS